MYSFGILMWELLTRGTPWKDMLDPQVFEYVQVLFFFWDTQSLEAALF